MGIAVFGAGVIGCWFGGMLAAAGERVTLIGRERVLREISEHGLTVSDLDGHRATVTLGAGLEITTSVEAAADASVVLVAVKSRQTAEAATTLARVLGGTAAVISLQNGVRNADVLRAALSAHPVAAAMVPFNVVRVGPGSYHRASSGTLLVERVHQAGWFQAACVAAGISTELRDDMRAVQWAKLVMNLNNAVNALSGKPLAAELADRAYRRCLAACQREALEVLAAAGEHVAQLTIVPPRWMPRMLELPDPVFRTLARSAIAIDPTARSSMWDDLEAGRPTEIDDLQGEVIALADRVRRPAPTNRRITELVRSAERGGRRDYSGDELWRLLTQPTP